tara:strand:+ start:1076 stop:1348 length:273 start_codon:yes stop_codon:yes gene_type:complete
LLLSNSISHFVSQPSFTSLLSTRLLKPLTTLVPNLNKSEASLDLGILEDIKEETFWLLGTILPNRTMCLLELFDVRWGDVDSDEDGKLFI